MLKWLLCVFIGTKCKWETVKTVELYRWQHAYGETYTRLPATDYYLQCKTCGDVRLVKAT
jgi:hypothetical protein